jgi:hypothetical protein
MRSSQLLPLSGIGAVLLIAIGFIVGGEPPDIDAPAQEVATFYADHDGDQQIAAALVALGALLFLTFTAAIVTLLRRARGDASPAATVSFAGGIVFVVGLAILAGLTFTLGDAADDVGAETIQTIHVLGLDMFFPLAVGVAAFMLGTGIAARGTDALPAWLSWAAIVIGVLAVTPAGFLAFLALGLWTLIVSVVLFMRARPAPAAGAPGGAGGAPPG